MVYYAALICYDGSEFYGMQRQPKLRTVQGVFEEALQSLFKEPVNVQASGRTDSGVHALGQVISFRTPFFIPPDSLLKGLNTRLPWDVQVIDLGEVNEDFHPLFSAIGKEYVYYFMTERLPFFHKQVSIYPYRLDWGLMEKSAEMFLGEHDFADFRCQGTDVATTVRRIDCFHVGKTQLQTPWGAQSVGLMRIQGSGFLKQMVRLLVGALWQVGRGQKLPLELQDHLDQPRGKAFGLAAPAQGLYLSRVFYAGANARWTRQD